jgi:hypothetical protein
LTDSQARRWAVRGMRDHKMATGRQRRQKTLDNPGRIISSIDEVQDSDQQDGDRPLQVHDPSRLDLRQDCLRPPHILLDHARPFVVGEEGVGESDDDRVQVDVGNPGSRVRALGDLVHAADLRQAAAYVEELPRTGVKTEPDRAVEEVPVRASDPRDVRQRSDGALSPLPVGTEKASTPATSPGGWRRSSGSPTVIPPQMTCRGSWTPATWSSSTSRR